MKIDLSIALFFIFSLAVQAQSNTVSAGGDAEGSNGSVSYSVGQVFYVTAEGENGNANQGVQQPFEIFVTLTNSQFLNDLTKITLLPNPAVDRVILSLNGIPSFEGYYYNLTDITGKIINKGFINSNDTTLDVSSLPGACYFLNVFQNNMAIKSFKLLKKEL